MWKQLGVLLFFALSQNTQAQSIIDYNAFWYNYSIRNYGTEEGMPSDEVYYIYEDSSGFIWIANIGGLVRYDGISLKVLPKGNEGGSFYEIIEDSKGSFWIPALNGGLYKFTGDSLKAFNEAIDKTGGLPKTAVLIDNDTLIVGIYGEGLFYFHNGELIKSYGESDGLVNNEIWKIATDLDGRIWIGTNGGLSILENGEFRNFTTENALPYDKIRGLTVMSNGDVWVGTDGEGIVIFRNQEPFKYLSQKDGLTGNFPQYFAENPIDSSIWIADHGSGLDRYKDGIFENLSTKNGLVSDYLTFVGFAKDGTAYVGTEIGMSVLVKNKLNVINERTKGVEYSSIISINKSGDGTVWLGSNGKGFKYQKNRIWETVDNPPKITNGYSAGSATDKDGNIWFTTQGTGIIKIVDFKIEKHLTKKDGLLNDFARCIAFDNQNRLWVGTNKGINVLNSNYQIEKAYTKDNGLPNDFCLSMISDKSGGIWYGSLGGGAVYFYDDSFTVYDTSNGLGEQQVLSFLEHSNGNIYIGTAGYNISVYDGVNLKTFNSKHGIPFNSITGMAEDDKGNIWSGTKSGIYKFDPNNLNESSNFEFTRYTTEDGMPSLNLETGYNATVARINTGEILFASLKGVTVVNPAVNTISTESFFPYIDNFVVDGENIDIKKPLKLTPKDRKIEISYSALNIQSPKKTTFRVKLEGIDNNWNYVGERRTAYFDFLPDGKYSFIVSAVGPDGQWSDKTANISFVVLPPFFKTWWFYTLSTFAFAGFIIVLMQIRSNAKMINLNRELQYQQKLHVEKERISRDLHDNVGSQITNLITGIEISNLHLKKNHLSKVEKVLSTLDVDARNTMTDLRETIWLMDKEAIEFNKFIEHLKSYFKRHKQYGISLNVTLNCTLSQNYSLNPTFSLNLTRIIQEAHNNTRKYAEASNFEIDFISRENTLIVTIKDDGKGMNVEEVLGSSEGNGLKNMKNRSEEIGGTFYIESVLNGGTIITLTFSNFSNSV
ncbi:MAG: two-component regulator propeller domain-containing protein [Balneolaceae bacterium]